MIGPSASSFLLAVVNGAKHLRADTVLLHCGKKHVTFKISPCMSGSWQCQQVGDVLQAIIDKAYKQGIRDAKA